MKLWGGRFDKPTNALVEEFTASINFDKRLYEYDIMGSMAHCKMLLKQGIIDQESAEKIIKGLYEIFQEIKDEKLKFDLSLEDIHMAVEIRLKEK